MQQSQANVFLRVQRGTKGIANRDRLKCYAITAYRQGREDGIDSVPGTWTCNCTPHPLPRATGPAGIRAISRFGLSICEMEQCYTCASFDLFNDEVPQKFNLQHTVIRQLSTSQKTSHAWKWGLFQTSGTFSIIVETGFQLLTPAWKIHLSARSKKAPFPHI